MTLAAVDQDNLRRIADALEALAAAETHRLHDRTLVTLTRSKNEDQMKAFIEAHPCPLCAKHRRH